MANTPAKEVIDLKEKPEAAKPAAAPQQPAQAQPKVFRYQKTRFPGNPVKLGKERIQFRLVKQNKGGYAPYGLFQTTDASLAEKLDKLAKAREQYVVRL